MLSLACFLRKLLIDIIMIFIFQELIIDIIDIMIMQVMVIILLLITNLLGLMVRQRYVFHVSIIRSKRI